VHIGILPDRFKVHFIGKSYLVLKIRYIMNKRQKMQVALGILFAVLLVFWLIMPGEIYSRILGVISCALGILSMVLSYRAEEKNKDKSA